MARRAVVAAETADAGLYVVATPLGNLGDISERALSLLRQVDLIAAEDTRHSGRLLHHFGIVTPLFSLHEHNEEQQLATLLERVAQGEAIALISDAGTPLISDPGYRIVREAHRRGLRVIPIPGASAVTTALSVAGIPSDRFLFIGFLPAKGSGRRSELQQLQYERASLIFYESTHRIVECVTDMAAILGPEREVALCRELTKSFETILLTELGSLCARLEREREQRLGEFVLVVRGAAPRREVEAEEALRMATILAQELPLRQAAHLAAKISGYKKNRLYAELLEMRDGE
ncbi:MAG: 16S rRNA (cytidine(1402)-2'-O)-methyltransferase [Gammaproteobacteria bacterium]|nr:16S rRNA (cytidine(1402)-2'-O)-methyltransferase [Gammaproteobacteria bacterium]